MKSRKFYSVGKDGRLRYKGKFVSNKERAEYVKQNYRAFTDKKGKIVIKTPDGRFAKKADIDTFKEVKRAKPELKKVSVKDGDWKDGKVLSSAYYFNFFCYCAIQNPKKSPVTNIEDGVHYREHYFGFATKSTRGVESRARRKHDKNFPEHTLIEFKMIEKKRMNV